MDATTLRKISEQKARKKRGQLQMDGRRDNSLHNNAIRGQHHNGNKRTPFISLVFVDVFFLFGSR